MTDHNREDLIERTAYERYPDIEADPPGTSAEDARFPTGWSREQERIAFIAGAVFEQAHTPTDDCPRCGNDPEDCYCNDEDMIAFREAGGFRRPAPPELQTEPTDAQVLAALNAEQAHDRQVNGMRPVVEESKSLDDWHSLNIERMRAVLRAAINETGEGRG